MTQTGPASPEAKAVVRHNALRHGLNSEDIVLPNEDHVAWDDYLRALVEDRKPVGALETALVCRAAELLWRLRRVAPALILATNADHHAERKRVERGNASGFLADRGQFLSEVRTLPDHANLAAIHRAEAHMNRQLMQALHELEALQARRAGNSAPLARVDVHGSVSA